MIGVVLKGYPRLSETFIAQELAGLEARGLTLHLVSLRHPTDARAHPVHDRIAAPITYLPEYLRREPGRVVRAWREVRRWPSYRPAWEAWREDLLRDRTPSRVRRFGQALVLARELRGRIDRLHAHFLHTPASVARYAALLLSVPWSVSAHAKDVWTLPEWEKRRKLAGCEWLVTCTAVNAAHLAALAPAPGRVSLVYHGLDLEAFPEPPPRPDPEPGTPLRILSVGRAVEKKGYDVLLEALARLPAGIDWRLRHIGGGALAGTLREQARRLGLAPRIEWSGPRTQPEVLEALRSADIFVLASRVARDGDRDGLPNVLLEACSQSVPCVATRVSGIPELIEDEVTGLLATPGDADGLAAALGRVLADAGLRRHLGEAGARRVRGGFSLHAGLDELERRLSAGSGTGPPGPAAGSPEEAGAREAPGTVAT